MGDAEYRHVALLRFIAVAQQSGGHMGANIEVLQVRAAGHHLEATARHHDELFHAVVGVQELRLDGSPRGRDEGPVHLASFAGAHDVQAGAAVQELDPLNSPIGAGNVSVQALLVGPVPDDYFSLMAAGAQQIAHPVEVQGCAPLIVAELLRQLLHGLARSIKCLVKALCRSVGSTPPDPVG